MWRNTLGLTSERLSIHSLVQRAANGQELRFASVSVFSLERQGPAGKLLAAALASLCRSAAVQPRPLGSGETARNGWAAQGRGQNG